MNVIIENIKKLMSENNIKQILIAQKAGLENSNLNRILNGKGNPTLKTLEKIENSIKEIIENRK